MAEQPAVDALRATVTKRVEADLDGLADAMLAAYQHEISAYGLLDDPSVLAEIRAGTRMSVYVVLQAVGIGRELSEQELAALKEIGTRRAAQGFPLHALLRAYQVGTDYAWRRVIEALKVESPPADVMGEVVSAVSVSILGLIGQVSGAVAQAYLEAERVTATTEERLRRDLFNELVWGSRSSGEPLRERAAAVGYRLAEAHCVVVARVDGAEEEPSLRSVTAALRSVRPCGYEAVVDMRGGLPVAIVPCSIDAGEALIADAVAKALANTSMPAGRVIAAVGRIERGVNGIATSFRQAIRALDTMQALGSDDTVGSYANLIPSMLLQGDPNAATDLYRSTIEPLVRHDAEQGTQLLVTLEAILAERGNVLAAAKRLFVHRHTLGARVERIEELTRRSLKDRENLLLLELGLRARDVLPSEGAGHRLLDNVSSQEVAFGTTRP